VIARQDRPQLGYLASQYPAPSHTFIRREISALRDEGWGVNTFSIRPASGSTGDEVEELERARTFSVLSQPIYAFLTSQLAWLFGHPLRYLGTIRLALNHRAPGVRSLLLAMAHFLEAGLLARELLRRNIDHLHNHFANSGATVGMLAAKLAGIGWSFTIHGISETDYPAGLLLGRKIETADWVACASWFMRAQGLRTVASDQWHKLHVVRCGIALDALPMRRKTGKTVDSLICVGRLSPEKGIAGLFEAFAMVLETHPCMKLRLVGDGPERRPLEDLAGKLGIEQCVDFLGAQPEAATLLKIADSDILILPSFLEGLPVVLLEAMAVGVPVVASRVAGIPELVEDGKTGLLFTPSNWDELAQRISLLICDPELYAKIADRAQGAVAAQFDVRLAVARLSELFQSRSAKPSATAASRGHTATFGLREAIVFSVIAVLIAVAVALNSGLSS
jgi:glycosyltransferase involved in cell wall biosynthesis